MKSRSMIRHHRQRIQQKRSYWWGRDISNDCIALGKVVKTPKPCSCLVCGNERKYSGKTMQERKSDIELKEMLY